VSCRSGIRAPLIRFNDLSSSRPETLAKLLSAAAGLGIRTAAAKPRRSFDFSLRAGLGTDLAIPTLRKEVPMENA
jgi:hypothetical protein